MTRYQKILLIAFTLVWLWAAWKPLFPADWLLENYLVFIFVPMIILTGRYFKLSNFSYTLITIFMILHVIGSHYTYGHVPFGDTLGEWFGSDRNMYDRLVHFAFGFLLAYPIREIFVRVTKVKGLWGYYLPFDVALSFSAIYEIVEWLTAVNVDAAAGIAFLGAQGDIWDAQKDMGLAGLGAILAMAIIFTLNWLYNKNFKNELRDGFAIDGNDAPLGEVRLRKFFEDTPRT